MFTRKAGIGLLGAALGGLALWAQAPSGDAMVQSMYAKFSASFTAGHGKGEDTEMLILASPGVMITSDGLANPYAISVLLDQIPQPAISYNPSGRSFSTVYGRILDSAITSHKQKAADLEQALQARHVLRDASRPGQPTPEYQAYLKYSNAYAVAEDALASAAEDQDTPKATLDKLAKAKADTLAQWTKDGYKDKVDAAKAAIRKVYDTSIGVLFQKLRQDLKAAELSSPSTWYPLTTNPPMNDWLSEQNWLPWRYQQSDPKQAAPAEKLPLNLNAAKPADGAKPAPKLDASWASSVSLSVEVKRVSIERPWMDQAIFGTHTWELGPGSDFTLVSSGNPADHEPGVMPLVITGILLARKLYLTGSWSGEASAGGAIPASFGPFSLGKAAKAATPPPASGTSTSSKGSFAIKADSPQIIGFFCHVIPKSPTPDPDLFRSKPTN